MKVGGWAHTAAERWAAGECFGYLLRRVQELQYIIKETTMYMKQCPRCKRLIPYGPTYCDECRPIVEAEMAEAKERRAEQRAKKYNREYNKKRDPKYAAFYRTKAWKMTSKAKLQSIGYKCEAQLQGCGRVASEVHHIKPLKTPEGWEERLEWGNLMGVCIQCHNILDGKNFKRKNDEGVIDLRTVER